MFLQRLAAPLPPARRTALAGGVLLAGMLLLLFNLGAFGVTSATPLDLLRGDARQVSGTPTPFPPTEAAAVRIVSPVNIRLTPGTAAGVRTVLRSGRVGEEFDIRPGTAWVEAEGYTWIPVLVDGRDAWIAQNGFLELLAPTHDFNDAFFVSPDGADANPGTQQQPWRTIQYAAANLLPGQTVFIRGGVYREGITPARSGTPDQPITFAAYPGEQPILDGGDVVARLIDLTDRRYIVFDGLALRNPYSAWAHVENSDHITFQNMVFGNDREILRASFGGLLLRYSSYNRVLNSTFDRWGYYEDGDQSGNHIWIQGNLDVGGYNLIEGNTFTYGGQGCIIVNSPYNIIRRNTFNNAWQKGLYVGWFVNPGGEPAGTEWPALHNLVEGNLFFRHGMSRYQHGGMAYEETAVGTIFRRNVIYSVAYTGMQITVFGNYAPQDYHNRWYNNTIVNNGLVRFGYAGTGIEMSNWGLGLEFHDNVFKNNIVWGNLPNADNGVIQLSLELSGDRNNPPLDGFVIAGNLFDSQRPQECATYMEASGIGYGNCSIFIDGIGDAPADWFNRNYPDHFWGNIEGDPLFAAYDPAADSFDLHLRDRSPAIDAAVPLTRALFAGSGNVIPVADAWYFHDGYDGMIAPDVIRVGDEEVTILAIDYDSNLITVDHEIVWEAGAPVNLPYSGGGPDIGAFERE